MLWSNGCFIHTYISALFFLSFVLFVKQENSELNVGFETSGSIHVGLRKDTVIQYGVHPLKNVDCIVPKSMVEHASY